MTGSGGLRAGPDAGSGVTVSRERAGTPPHLEGIRVISMAEQYPGPYATLLLADLGADVILVERPRGGDPGRQFPAFFESLNRNKRSVALDLKSGKGREAFLRLAARSDVVLEGFRPGTAKRLGVDYETVAGRNLRVVYASISGFGQDGPYRDRPAHDLSYQAVAGMFYDRICPLEQGSHPRLTVGDLSAGMFAALGILTALVARDTTGRGTYVDVSMTDGLVSWMTTQLVPAMNSPVGPWFPHDAGYELFRTADGGLISLSIAHEDTFWNALCNEVGLRDIATLKHDERVDRHEQLQQRIARAIEAQPRSYWERALSEAGVPFGPVLDLDEVPRDPHIRARGLIVEVPATRTEPKARHVRQPLKIGDFAGGPSTHAPRFGEHTREVLSWAGYSKLELEDLISVGPSSVAKGDPETDVDREQT